MQLPLFRSGPTQLRPLLSTPSVVRGRREVVVVVVVVLLGVFVENVCSVDEVGLKKGFEGFVCGIWGVVKKGFDGASVVLINCCGRVQQICL